MSRPDLYLNSDQQVPDITSKEADLRGWLGLGGDAEKVHATSIFYKKPDEDPLEQSCFADTSRLNELDWACDIDWFDEDSSWRGWIPICPDDPPLAPWFMKMDVLMETIERDRALLFEPSRAVDYKRDYFCTNELVTSVSTLHSGATSNNLPPAFDISPIDDLYDASHTLQAFGASVKRAILDRLGWLRWWKAVMPDLESEIPETLYKQLLQLTDKNYESRGYLIDINRMWQQANFAFWIHHQIPIYYLWGAEERLEERYSKLNPKLIAADTGTDGNKIVINDIPIDDGWLRAAASTWKYDDFMQRRDASPIKDHLSYESDSRFFVIDFQGWGRRELSIAADPARYAARFHFLVHDEKGYHVSVVIFWRWRKRAGYEDGDETKQGNMDTQDHRDLWTLRELYRDEYTPKKNRQYDEETGLPITPMPPIFKAWTIPDSFYPPSPPVDKRVQVPTPTGSSDSYVALPSLLSRLSIFPEPLSPASNDRANQLQQRGRPFSRNVRDFVSSTPRLLNRLSSRSRSPRNIIGPLARNLPPRGTEFRTELHESMSIFTYLESTFSLLNPEAWNYNFINQGILVVRDKRVEARMRYYASCVPTIRHIRQVLRVALEHRQAFQIGVKVRDFHFFPDRPRLGASSIMIAAQYSTDYQEPPLVYHSPAAFMALYSGRMADLLTRPHARAFIGLGGACSWVAH